MNELYELHFHGNRREIEKEKQRKRELMSHFPKTLGTVDETRYVLVDDDNKSKFENSFGDKEVDLLPVAVISDESEKTKEQKSISSFDNNRKTISFDSWKEGSMFLEPKKENRTVAQKLPFDFDGNTAKEEENPFQSGIQFPELGTVGGNQPRTTTEGNDSLGLESRGIVSVADTLKTGNVNNNRNTVPNNAVTATPEITPGLYGNKSKKDYSKELNRLKQELPPIAASILNNSVNEIVVLDNMFSVDENGVVTPRIGRYYASKNKIYLDSWHVDKRTLLSEAIHAVQDYLGMTGTGKSNLEFQEHVIKDLYYHHKYRKTKDIEYLNGISTTESKDYIYLINNALDEKGVLDLNKFLSEINYYFDEFQSHYKKSDSYQTQGVKNFNYNWIKLLHIFDIEYKY